MITIGSLFSGIGGLELGLEMAIPGARVVWQAERDPYASAVLAKHWPTVKRYDDVRSIDAQAERVDIICGGFPCQDISNAGKRAGITGERSGLWSEYARIVRVLRPRFVFVENVSALVNRGIDRVLGDLAACGFDAQWDCFRAAEVGAPHRRERLFILAYAHSLAGHTRRAGHADEGARGRDADRGAVRSNVADADGAGLAQWSEQPAREERAPAERGGLQADSWPAEPDVGRVAYGIPSRVDRLRCLGNAVVPQQAALAWRTLMARVTP